MLDYRDFIDECQKNLTAEQILVDELMSKHTTFKIGGKADIMLLPHSNEELEQIVKLLSKYPHDFMVMGNGSNILVSDKGIRGVVIKLGNDYSYMHSEGDKIVVGAGALLSDVSKLALEIELTGLEFACGIPGSVGGAVFMNAGAYDGEMSFVVEGVRAISPKGEVKHYALKDLDLSYRHSIFQTNGELISEVTFSLKKGNYAAINARMTELTQKRTSKQPLEYPSAGSVFKRPVGYFAGTLIEEAGLKGLTIGDAKVSTKHSGFIINIGNATANDVCNLIKAVQERVYEKFQISLQPELKLIGEK